MSLSCPSTLLGTGDTVPIRAPSNSLCCVCVCVCDGETETEKERERSDFSFHGNGLNKDFNRQEYECNFAIPSLELLRENPKSSQSFTL